MKQRRTGAGSAGLSVFELVGCKSTLLLALCGFGVAQGADSARIENLERFTLARGACYGTCPVYRVTIFQDGRVEYMGEHFVKVEGMRTKKLGPQAMRRLKAEVEGIAYMRLLDRYDSREAGCASVSTDASSVSTSVIADGKAKSVDHYLGCMGALGERLKSFEDRIDEIVGTVAWVGTTRERDLSVERSRRVPDEKERQAAAARSREVASTQQAIDSWSEARQAEAKGDYAHAVRLYRRLARIGHGPAAKRLGQIYATGMGTVLKDLAESRAWYATAYDHGESVAGRP